jgi:hypothetical protein
MNCKWSKITQESFPQNPHYTRKVISRTPRIARSTLTLPSTELTALPSLPLINLGLDENKRHLDINAPSSSLGTINQRLLSYLKALGGALAILRKFLILQIMILETVFRF